MAACLQIAGLNRADYLFGCPRWARTAGTVTCMLTQVNEAPLALLAPHQATSALFPVPGWLWAAWAADLIGH